MTNQRGISVLEVLLMSSVMIVISLSFASMVTNQSKGVTYLEDKLSRTALGSNLRIFLSDSGFCKNLFEQVVAPTAKKVVDLEGAFTRPAQVAALQKILQKQNDRYSYDRLRMEKMTLENSDLSAPNSTGTMDVALYPERLRTGGGPDKLQPVRMKVAFQVDGAYKITSCSLAETTPVSKQLQKTEDIHCERSRTGIAGGPCVFRRDHPDGATREWEYFTDEAHDLCTLTLAGGYGGGLWGQCMLTGAPKGKWRLLVAASHDKLVSCSITCYDFK